MTIRSYVAAALVGLVALTGCATTQPQVAARPESGAAAGSGYTALAPVQPASGLPTLSVGQLPAEGIDTLELIAAGGPFPYAKDGSTFGNREGILPARPTGFYAEFTVVTPGEDERGARRIVGGDDGSRFYTADHYSSFREVVSE